MIPSQSHTALPFILRRIAGRFDACRRIAGGTLGAPSAASDLLTTTLSFVAVLILPLLALALIAGLVSSALHTPHHLAFAGPSLAVLGTTDAKAIRDELMSAFEAFKTAHTDQLNELKTKGSADAALVAKVEASNAAVTTLTAKLHEVEKAAARPQFEAEPSKELKAEQGRVAKFLALVRGESPEAITVAAEDVKNAREYQAALRGYYRKGTVQNSMSVGSNPEGGYWVAPDTGGRIESLIYQSSPMRQYANVETIGTDALEGSLDLDEADAGWVGETATRSGDTTTPKLGVWRIPVHEMYAEPRTTQKILDDSSRNVEEWLGNKVSEKLTRTENAAFVNANGVNKPKGFLGYTPNASAPTSAAWQRIQFTKSGKSAAFADTDPADKLIDLIHTMKVELRSGAIWAANNTTIAAMRKLKDGDGHYIFQPDVSQGWSGRVHGFPVVEFADMPDLGATSYSLAFANFKAGYTIVDRLGIRVLRDPLTLKGWVKFYTTRRVGGDVTNFEAIKVMQFAA
jgi:HK97 family phage major capsid protein